MWPDSEPTGQGCRGLGGLQTHTSASAGFADTLTCAQSRLQVKWEGCSGTDAVEQKGIHH